MRNRPPPLCGVASATAKQRRFAHRDRSCLPCGCLRMTPTRWSPGRCKEQTWRIAQPLSLRKSAIACDREQRGPCATSPNVAAGLTLEPAARLDPRNPHGVDGVADHVAGAGARLWGLGHILCPCVLFSAKHIINRGQKRGDALCPSFLYSGKQPSTLKQLIF